MREVGERKSERLLGRILRINLVQGGSPVKGRVSVRGCLQVLAHCKRFRKYGLSLGAK